jgi:hypothetical protein
MWQAWTIEPTHRIPVHVHPYAPVHVYPYPDISEPARSTAVLATQSGSPDALLRRGSLRTVRATRRGTRLKQATGAISGVQRRWFLLSVGGSAEAGGVNESGFVRQAFPVDDDDLPGYRLAGGAVPLLPLAWALWLAVGVQQPLSADRAGPVLPAEQVQGSAVE